MSLVVRGSLVAALVAMLVLITRMIARTLAPWQTPRDNPAAFRRRGRAATTRTLVVCTGDSITHGVMSADYVALLRESIGGDGFEFVNAGINGNLAWNVAQRLDAVVACRPDAVTILVGTNDVLATMSPSWEASYRRQQHIIESPTLAWYRENVLRVVDRLRAETGARVAILDLPPLGEDLGSGINARIADYNAALRELATATGIPLLPLHDSLVALLPEGHSPPPFAGRRDLMGRALVRRLALRQSWNEISAAHGMVALTDHVHLNDRAAAVVAELITEWLTQQG